MNAKYTVVEYKNPFGTKVYELRNPSGVGIDTDYADEQKLQRRADALNKEIEVALASIEGPVQPLTDLHAKIAALEAENAKLREEDTRLLLELIGVRNELSTVTQRFEMENERANGQAGMIVRMKEEVTYWRKKAEYEVIYADSLAKQALAHLEAQRTDSLIDALQKLMKPAPTEAPATSEDDDYSKSDAYYQDLTDTFMGYDGTNNPVPKEAPATSEVTLTEDEIDFLVRNLGDYDLEDYDGTNWDFTAPSYLIPDALYKKLEKLTDFTLFSNHYKLAREYNTPANRAAIEAKRQSLVEDKDES